MIKAILRIAASVAGYFLSERYRAKKRQAARDRIAGEVAGGDEDAVNARLGRFRAVWPWLVVGILVAAAGCSCTRTVYVREQDRVVALKPGGVHTNVSDAVEWIVPRSKMTQLVIEAEGGESEK